MVPSPRFVLLMLGPLGLAVLTLLDDGMLVPMLVVDGVVALLAVFDAWLARGRAVDVRRRTRNVYSVGRNNHVELELRSKSKRTLNVRVTDDVFDQAEVEGLPAAITLAPVGRATVAYHVRPHRRGAYELRAHTVRYPSPIGLWVRQLRIEAKTPVQVYPDVKMVQAYELLARQDREHRLIRATRRVGGESEFERLREYRRDDEYRAIDWKATARRQKLIARQYQLERNQNIMFALDAGRLMAAEVDGLPMFDHALNAVLLLSHVASRGGDRVGLMTFADRVQRFVAPAAGPDAPRRIVRATFDVHPQLVESDYELTFNTLSARVRRRTLMVVFTQVIDEVSAEALVRYTRGLLPRHLPLLVLFRDPDLESMALVRAADRDHTMFDRAAAAELLTWRGRMVRTLQRFGANVLDVEPRELSAALINRYLEIKVRHLL